MPDQATRKELLALLVQADVTKAYLHGLVVPCPELAEVSFKPWRRIFMADRDADVHVVAP